MDDDDVDDDDDDNVCMKRASVNQIVKVEYRIWKYQFIKKLTFRSFTVQTTYEIDEIERSAHVFVQHSVNEVQFI